ncbi:uncharacterized protein LOC118647152 [Monomorium pharaonis]|uniref:uncharacterized protein LOC118647152 n=1 Tax=Monomorium pharaonis TaxID=307658 RepID=UPI0017474D76|nr:uncharacterized protein LOC118647152 [Monomorium pharaonis]
MGGNAVKWLATMLPEFSGFEDENVNVWMRRVNKAALVHGATDGVTLLAAASKLTKFARKWFEAKDDEVLETWSDLKQEMPKMFNQKTLVHKILQKVEARKWNMGQETFEQYAISKCAIMCQLDFPAREQIHLLVSGIPIGSLRATALSVKQDTLVS